MRLLRSHGWLLAVLAIASFTMLWRLDVQPIVNFDEAIHGEVSWEMLAPRSREGEVGVERGEWLTLSYMNGPYFRKPPGKIWMTAGLFKVLPIETPPPTPPQDEGESNSWIMWALRLPSAVAGILTILLTAWWMWEWMRSRWAALLAGIILATSPAIFEHAFRTGEMDGVLTLFVTTALYAWWKATKANDESMTNLEIRNSTFGLHSTFDIRPSTFRWLLASSAAIGLAVMTKSAAGLLPLPIIALDTLLHRRWRTIPIRTVWFSVLLFSVLVVPWHAVMSLLHGATFWNEYLGFHVVRRITEQLHNAGAGPLWYIGAMRNIFSPWVWWLLPAVGASLLHVYTATHHTPSKDSTPSPFLTIVRNGDGRVHDARPDTLVLCLVWIATVLGAYTAARTKFAWYLLPMLPACAMLIAWCVTRCNSTLRVVPLFHDREKGRCRVARVAAAVLLVVTISIAGTRTYTRLATSYPPSPFPTIADVLYATQADGLVAYGFAWQEQPAAYFTLHTSHPQIKLSDGLMDATHAATKLTERDRGWLITKTITELPEELRAIVGAPHQIDDWLLWPRVAPQ